MVKEFLKKMWGTGSSKGFRMGAWGIAVGAFAAWCYFDYIRANGGKFSSQDMLEWNKKITSKPKEKKSDE